MNEYKINTKSEVKRVNKKEYNSAKNVMIASIIALLVVAIFTMIETTYTTKIILEKQLKINELQNKVEQQIELIDALQQ